MYIDGLLTFYQAIIETSVAAVSWLFEPIKVLGIPPIALITFGGLLAYLVIAIIRWIL